MRALHRPSFIALLITVLLVLFLALTACGGQQAPTEGEVPTAGDTQTPPPMADSPVPGGTVTLAMWTAPSGVFNPMVSESQYDTDVTQPVIETLLKANENLVYTEPVLATSYDISEDQKSLTFHLRKGVRWHDGEPFTADDVAYTLRFVLDPDYPGPYASDFLVLEGAEDYQGGNADNISGVEVIDDHTITLHLTKVYGPALATFGAMYVLPKHRFEGQSIKDAATIEPSKNPIGTGPYKFVKYQTDQYVELERNDDWWGGTPNIDRVIWQVVNQEVATGSFQNGELDALGAGAGSNIDPADLELIDKLSFADVWEHPDFGYQFMFVNLTQTRFQDVRVRQALAYAINRQAMVDQLLLGHGTVMNGPMLPVSWAYNNDVNAYEYNPDRATELLRDAGWEDRDGDGVLENEAGDKFEVTLLYPQGNPLRESTAPLIQDDLGKVGINMQLEFVDFDVLMDRAISGTDYDLGLLGWGLTYDPDQLSVWTPGAVYNMTRFDDPRSQELLESGAYGSMEVADRKPYYQQWVKLMNEQLPYVFLYTQNKIYVFNENRIKGYNKNILGPTDNIQDWWIPVD